MSRVLQSLIAKLKRRRKSRSRNPKTPDLEAQDEQVSTLPDHLGDLKISDTAEESNSHVFGADAFDFHFAFKTNTTWPGPAYDEAARFAPGIFDKPRAPKRKAKPKRRLSQEEKTCPQHQSKERSISTTMKPTVKAVARPKKSSRGPGYFGNAPTRDPPHHLLNLPGEIRNQIYRILYSTNEPIKAQFRPVVRPKHVRRGTERLPDTIRRLPREPTLALVCRQLQREVLSLFYSENKFTFSRSDNRMLQDWIMTHYKNMDKWTPKFGFAESLRYIEVRFGTGTRDDIIYTLKKLSNGKFDISSNTRQREHCVCFDRKFLETIQNPDVGWEKHLIRGDLMERTVSIVMLRKTALGVEKTLHAVGTDFRPNHRTCEWCGLVSLRLLEGGG